MNLFLLYCALCFVNVVLQTLRSVCTIKCSSFVAACMNAVAYGLYVFVIFYTNADGLSLWGKAAITAAANFSGVYLANAIFNRLFKNEARWAVNVSVPIAAANEFMSKLSESKLIFHSYGRNSDGAFTLLTVYCPTRADSKKLKEILPSGSMYDITECVKTL